MPSDLHAMAANEATLVEYLFHVGAESALMREDVSNRIRWISTIMSETKSAASFEAEAGSSPMDRSKLLRSLSATKQAIRRPELRRIVPLADTTIYEMEQRGEFPRRFYLTPRCVVWDLAEVEAWLDERRRASDAEMINRAPAPDVRRRKARPVRE
jgi:predicted DNA-binding transcriptional regulator AlpA